VDESAEADYDIAMKTLSALALFAALSIAAAGDKDTMCVKQKNGMYKCKASGKIEKEPCCEVPSNPAPTPTTTPKKQR
jgi:hypothetical protein